MDDNTSSIRSLPDEDDYSALSEHVWIKCERYWAGRPTTVSDVGVGTESDGGIGESVDTFNTDFGTLNCCYNSSNNIQETKFWELQKKIDVANDQFQNALEQNHDLMLQNEILLKKLHEAEVRMQKLSELNFSEKNNIDKLQNQLLEYEQNNCNVLDELEMAKKENDVLLTNITEKNKKIIKLEDELTQNINDKNKCKKKLNDTLQRFQKKLESSHALGLLNKSMCLEIDNLKNLKADMEKSIKEMKEVHKIQLTKLDDQINCQKMTIERCQFENEQLSVQYKLITNELINFGCLNNSQLSDKDNSFDNTPVTNIFDKQFTKMAKLINILKDEKNTIILESNETISVCNRKKILDDMQTQMKELRQIHSSALINDNSYSKILKKIEVCNQIFQKNKILGKDNAHLSNQLKKLQEQNVKKIFQITMLKNDMSGMRSEIEQKTAELKKLKTDYSEYINTTELKILQLKDKIASNGESMKSHKNIIKSYRQKFSEVASEIYKVKVLARRYNDLNKVLKTTLMTERSSFKIKIYELQQKCNSTSFDAEERIKLIEQKKQEQKTKSEALINELMAKVKMFNQIAEKNETLGKENTRLTQLLHDFETKRNYEITALKNDKSGMEISIDQKTAELKKLETDYSEYINTTELKILQLKDKIASNGESMKSHTNIIKSYRQKFSEVASEIYKVKVLARRYNDLNKVLNTTLMTERSSFKIKIYELQQKCNSTSFDADERIKLIEQEKQEQKTKSEALINELMAKVKMFNQIAEKNETLGKENTLFTMFLLDFETQRNIEITALKNDMSGMEISIDQKTAELKKLGTDHSEKMNTLVQKILQLKDKIASNIKSMESHTNIVRSKDKSYRQKFSEVASEIIKVVARCYNYCDELHEISNLIEQGKQQKTKCETNINKFMEKFAETEAAGTSRQSCSSLNTTHNNQVKRKADLFAPPHMKRLKPTKENDKKMNNMKKIYDIKSEEIEKTGDFISEHSYSKANGQGVISFKEFSNTSNFITGCEGTENATNMNLYEGLTQKESDFIPIKHQPVILPKRQTTNGN